jgi:hypothetical protein
LLTPYAQHQLARIYLLVGENERGSTSWSPYSRSLATLRPGWLKVDPTLHHSAATRASRSCSGELAPASGANRRFSFSGCVEVSGWIRGCEPADGRKVVRDPRRPGPDPGGPKRRLWE